MTDQATHILRSDAQDNRERILDAARTLFATAGPEVAMRDIARQAGVGLATVYRRFPTKEALAAEALADRMGGCHAVIEEGLADPDPWHGLRLVIAKICELNTRDLGATAAIAAAFPTVFDLPAARSRSLTSLAELTRRAKATGRLRADLVVDDVVLVFMANNGIQAAAPETLAAASRRFAQLAIRSLEAA
ncbi:TetR/AcrR family transcriptional regulator [Kutzneria sp. CA-103260]|uniref:TetR/AcrR family transcriptional regulator n=1 Tax=Kutzneria sp. CA-103260 TaxID=2802641 RepID=UPI001BF11814|nr:TetR/AcrR family transcriptional regulator [Kutzneria sp. CA-103260]QUQ66550.1 TetR family transcriptional regulator [Kutzneria sp. CA-103260]